MAVEITCTVRGPLPRRSGLRRGGGSAINIPFEKIAREILGRQYVLSLVLSGDTLARRINRAYRKKDYATAISYFGKLTSDPPAKVMLERCGKLGRGEQVAELDENMVFRIVNK